MNWEPIKIYDAMKKKPLQFVVFLVEESTNGRNTLPQTISTSRMMGFRVITHFCLLPDVPANQNKD